MKTEITMRDRLIKGVEVRRHNGQCSYGPWMSVDDESVPTWVGDMIADARAENEPSDRVSSGGEIWVSR